MRSMCTGRDRPRPWPRSRLPTPRRSKSSRPWPMPACRTAPISSSCRTMDSCRSNSSCSSTTCSSGKGLLEVDAAGKVRRWDAYFYSAGGSGSCMLRDRDDPRFATRVGALLQKMAADPANGILTVWTEDDLRRLGRRTARVVRHRHEEGFYSAIGHDALLEKTPSKGGHGFAPTRPELHASLVMRGPDVRQRGNLGVVRMSQIGPTIASWFVGRRCRQRRMLRSRARRLRRMAADPPLSLTA